ncbi:MAG: hypothetical protein VB084_10075 [Syntrophomonadaceae bacterium]|nr:hypothetical protein [Syntrophomonadaceae bacterium]
MFKTFLNKEGGHVLDLSTFNNYTPEQILFYYYNSRINITLDAYYQMREWLENGYGDGEKLGMWLEFFTEELQVEPDLEILQDSEYMNVIGPYYYGPTCTQFYITRLYTLKNDPLTSDDFTVLLNLHKVPPVKRELQKYLQTRKTAKKTIKNKDDLIREISMCSASLKQIEEIGQCLDYLNIFLEGRQEILNQEEISPRDPGSAPQKPDKPDNTTGKFTFLQILKAQNKRDISADYNRNMKIYYIKCREYDKACERYKEALQNWDEYKENFIKKCRHDIREATGKIKEVTVWLGIYQEIIRRSVIHLDYQQVEILGKFKRYLETGRADDLQGCMNLYEGERHWQEIKASQDRIENTIYFLQPDNEALRLASLETSKLIASTVDR